MMTKSIVKVVIRIEATIKATITITLPLSVPLLPITIVIFVIIIIFTMVNSFHLLPPAIVYTDADRDGNGVTHAAMPSLSSPNPLAAAKFRPHNSD